MTSQENGNQLQHSARLLRALSYLALPVCREVMLRVYRDQIVGPPPVFPAGIEERISLYLQGEALAGADVVAAASEFRAVASYRASPGETEWLVR